MPLPKGYTLIEAPPGPPPGYTLIDSAADNVEPTPIWDRFKKAVTTDSPFNPYNWKGMAESAVESPFSDRSMQEAHHQADVLSGKVAPEPFERGDIGEGLGAAVNYGVTAGALKGLSMLPGSKVAAVSRGAGRGAWDGATERVPASHGLLPKLLGLPDPKLPASLAYGIDGALAGRALAGKPGMAVGAVGGATAPIVRGAVKGGRQALKNFKTAKTLTPPRAPFDAPEEFVPPAPHSPDTAPPGARTTPSGRTVGGYSDPRTLPPPPAPAAAPDLWLQQSRAARKTASPPSAEMPPPADVEPIYPSGQVLPSGRSVPRKFGNPNAQNPPPPTPRTSGPTAPREGRTAGAKPGQYDAQRPAKPPVETGGGHIPDYEHPLPGPEEAERGIAILREQEAAEKLRKPPPMTGAGAPKTEPPPPKAEAPPPAEPPPPGQKSGTGTGPNRTTSQNTHEQSTVNKVKNLGDYHLSTGGTAESLDEIMADPVKKADFLDRGVKYGKEQKNPVPKAYKGLDLEDHPDSTYQRLRRHVIENGDPLDILNTEAEP